MANAFSPYILWTHTAFKNAPASQDLRTEQSPNFPEGTNIYVSTAISQIRADDFAVAHGIALAGYALIDSWSVYEANGQITAVNPGTDFQRNQAHIDTCANITIGFGAVGGSCTTFTSVFRK
jgi:hypothetical protein